MNKILLICAFLAFTAHFVESAPQEGMTGGLTDERPVNERLRNMVGRLRPEISRQLASRTDALLFNSNSPLFPISYRAQVVNGTNYFLKIRVVLGRKYAYYNVRVYEDLKGNASLVGITGPMNNNEHIGYF